ncbi:MULTISPECIES: hypothetical protein [unclassified Thioclava]|nr:MULTISPECIES: hypothetical protein [unclassified Thioclava]
MSAFASNGMRGLIESTCALLSKLSGAAGDAFSLCEYLNRADELA